MSRKVTTVRVSRETHKKTAQLRQFLRLSSAKWAWGKDQTLLRSNLLLAPSARNYTVLLAMGRRRRIADSIL